MQRKYGYYRVKLTNFIYFIGCDSKALTIHSHGCNQNISSPSAWFVLCDHFFANSLSLVLFSPFLLSVSFNYLNISDTLRFV